MGFAERPHEAIRASETSCSRKFIFMSLNVDKHGEAISTLVMDCFMTIFQKCTPGSPYRGMGTDHSDEIENVIGGARSWGRQNTTVASTI